MIGAALDALPAPKAHPAQAVVVTAVVVAKTRGAQSWAFLAAAGALLAEFAAREAKFAAAEAFFEKYDVAPLTNKAADRIRAEWRGWG